MMKRSIKRKLVKARMILNQTLQKILDINHHRKRIQHLEDTRQREVALSEELKVLNKIANYQARLIRHYEDTLEDHR
jgi:hypothetical protein